MNRLIMILVAFALVVAACSGAADETSDSGMDNGPSTEAKAAAEEPTAPDFTLALEPSGEFVLSQEVKPVYMVFWAEW
jgi:hypothetical protein